MWRCLVTSESTCSWLAMIRDWPNYATVKPIALQMELPDRFESAQ